MQKHYTQQISAFSLPLLASVLTAVMLCILAGAHKAGHKMHVSLPQAVF